MASRSRLNAARSLSSFADSQPSSSSPTSTSWSRRRASTGSQVVVDDGRIDGGRRRVHDPDVRIGEQQQEAQQPLLVEDDPGHLAEVGEGQRQ
jgi:hypothetical protein